MERSRDWFAQAERDLEQAEASRADGRHEWACFAAGPAQPTWSYVVVVTGADFEQRFDVSERVGFTQERDNLFVLPVAPGGREDRFGGGQEDDPLQPPILDLIAPPGLTQQRILRDYGLRTNRPVELPGVVPAEVGKEG